MLMMRDNSSTDRPAERQPEPKPPPPIEVCIHRAPQHAVTVTHHTLDHTKHHTSPVFTQYHTNARCTLHSHMKDAVYTPPHAWTWVYDGRSQFNKLTTWPGCIEGESFITILHKIHNKIDYCNQLAKTDDRVQYRLEQARGVS